MPFETAFWTETVREVAAAILGGIPAVLGALGLLVLGWLIARLVQWALDGILRRMGVDGLAERAGATRLLTRLGLDPSASHFLARLVFWLVLIVFLLAAAESLGLQGVVNTLEELVGYLPSVIAAALILLVGGLIARVVGDALSALATEAEVATGPLLGQAARYVILLFTVILALEQLGVETTLLTTATVAVIGATALALAIAFGFGSRDLARNIMAGFHAREAFSTGQQLRVRGHTGRLVSIGSVKSVLDTGDGLISLPNTSLTDEEVALLLVEEGDGAE